MTLTQENGYSTPEVLRGVAHADSCPVRALTWILDSDEPHSLLVPSTRLS